MSSRRSDTVNNRVDVVIPLRQWILKEGGANKQCGPECHEEERQEADNSLRKTTVAYGIAELLKHASRSGSSGMLARPSNISHLDNFAVRFGNNNNTSNSSSNQQPFLNTIEGVDMISPRLSVDIIEPSFLFDDDDDSKMGRYLEVEFSSSRLIPSTSDQVEAERANAGPTETTIFVNQIDEDDRCYWLGVLLYELYFHNDTTNSDDHAGEPAYKKSRNLMESDVTSSAAEDSSVQHSILSDVKQERYDSCAAAVQEHGFPSSLCLVIQNLLDCDGNENRPDNAYESLEGVIMDLHLLLLDPERFLFNQELNNTDDDKVMLSFREHTLYGRENEVFVITESFCRVSGGGCESLFIGGFSGSGKSRLINGLIDRVDGVGGYVIKHKFDQMSKERSMLDIVALFNDLCLLISEKNNMPDLVALVDDLIGYFGPDLSSLARLLPNIKALAPNLISDCEIYENDASDGQMISTTHLLLLTLQRFVSVVSSAAHPVVLFLDDLQWCDESVFTLIESILCDTSGSTCFFFVGTYRSNEVTHDHFIFHCAKRLKSFGVHTTMLSLEGLQPSDLNTMISDALCVFPRISEPLSDIVFQKTKGIPFFVLEFMRSLVDRGLLEYSVNKRSWVWDEDDVCSMEITGNILHLLSFKMVGLSTRIQSALKIAACFGIMLEHTVVALLGADPKYADINDRLEYIVKEGFMVKDDNLNFRFVHDQVQEAAYSLIPDADKNMYHYTLAKSLYLTSKGKDADDMLLLIADQMKYGIVYIKNEEPGLQIDVAKHYESSGIKAARCLDYLASRSYLKIASSLLPHEHWESHHELSHRITLVLAKSIYSCGDAEEAQGILQELLLKCRSIEEQVPVQEMLVMILVNEKKLMAAYTLSCDVLSQLGETIPTTLYFNQSMKTIQTTLSLLESMSVEDLLELPEMDTRLTQCMNFYSTALVITFFLYPDMVPIIACKMVQLTIESGICHRSITGFVSLAVVLCWNILPEKDIENAMRIGKAAMSCLLLRYKKSALLNHSFLSYYGHVAFHFEPFQLCCKKLQQSLDALMLHGDVFMAGFYMCQYMKLAFPAGGQLPTLLQKVDSFLESAETYKLDFVKPFLANFRCTIVTLMGSGDLLEQYDLPTKLYTEATYVHAAIKAFWQGYTERCQHFIDKFLVLHKSSSSAGNLMVIAISFIHGLTTFQLMKKNFSVRLRTTALEVIKELKHLRKFSRWNFQNKVELLEAELKSHEGKHNEAKDAYLASISSAQKSGFIHEQGLACEFAGIHCRNTGDNSSARNFFDQAKLCYTEWGSQIKVDSITRQLDLLQCQSTGMNSPLDD